MAAIRQPTPSETRERSLDVPGLVLAALDPLDSEEREAVWQALRDLQRQPDNNPTDPRLRRIASDEPIYVVRVAPQVRLIVRLTPDMVEALDVVRPETLFQMFPDVTSTHDRS